MIIERKKIGAEGNKKGSKDQTNDKELSEKQESVNQSGVG